MIGSNKVIIAAAGSGKTTHLVQEALKITDENVLIATYTESNEAEIRHRFLEINGHIPPNIFIITWFSFLITHGVKPFQGVLFNFDVNGMILVETQSGYRFNINGRPIYWGENDLEKYFFDKGHRIYSDKLAKLVMRCDEKSDGSVIDRISRIFKHIFVDEVQDLAGYDLDILLRFFSCRSNVLLVGDPRQVTYQTHHERKYDKYSGGKLVDFLKSEVPKGITYIVDDETLNTSHRNTEQICKISSKLYPELKPSTACECKKCRSSEHELSGLFIVSMSKRDDYLKKYQPVQLRLNTQTKDIRSDFTAMNFGQSKGLGFDHVLIYPTADMVKWMKDNKQTLKDKTRAQFYVALTRARQSVAILHNFKDSEIMEGFSIYS